MYHARASQCRLHQGIASASRPVPTQRLKSTFTITPSYNGRRTVHLVLWDSNVRFSEAPDEQPSTCRTLRHFEDWIQNQHRRFYEHINCGRTRFYKRVHHSTVLGALMAYR